MYPNLSPEIAQFPKAVIYTTEFDMFRKNAEEARDLLKEKVLDYGVLKGMFHEAYAFYDMKGSDAWFRDIAKVFDKYQN